MMAKQITKRGGSKSAGVRHKRRHQPARPGSIGSIADSAEAVADAGRRVSAAINVSDILRASARSVDEASATLAEVGEELFEAADVTEQAIQDALDFQERAIREAARAQEQAIVAAQMAMGRALAAASAADREHNPSVGPLTPPSSPSYED